MIKVFGHKAPDTDATCSAIACAWLLSQKGEKASPYILGEFNRETMFVLKHFEIGIPETLEKLEENDSVVIVDTNNPDELPENLDKVNILSIIDHHKLAGLKTASPMTVMIKPLAATSTIIYQMISGEGIELDRKIAGIMLAAIISDTLKFSSPTTTDTDKLAALALSKIAGVDIDDLAEKMFEAKSDLSGMNPKDILLSDSKVFEMGEKKVRVSVHETTKPENAKSMHDEIVKTMNEIKLEENLAAMYFFVVDILNSASDLITSTDEEKKIAEKAFSEKFDGDFMHLNGVVSRKKQMVPNLEKAYNG